MTEADNSQYPHTYSLNYKQKEQGVIAASKRQLPDFDRPTNFGLVTMNVPEHTDMTSQN